MGDPELLIHAGIANASLVVLTIDKAASAERSVAHIRTNFPSVPIVSRARDLAAVSRLLTAGASKALPDVIESSMGLVSLALEMLKIPQDDIEMLVQGVREHNYELVSSEPVQQGNVPLGEGRASAPRQPSKLKQPTTKR